jgi:hypothetical protein
VPKPRLIPAEAGLCTHGPLAAWPTAGLPTPRLIRAEAALSIHGTKKSSIDAERDRPCGDALRQSTPDAWPLADR